MIKLKYRDQNEKKTKKNIRTKSASIPKKKILKKNPSSIHHSDMALENIGGGPFSKEKSLSGGHSEWLVMTQTHA